MEYFLYRYTGKVYGSDNFGKNMLEIVNGERYVIPVCEIPSVAVRLDYTDEEAWKMVEAGTSGVARATDSKGWRQRLMVWRGR